MKASLESQSSSIHSYNENSLEERVEKTQKELKELKLITKTLMEKTDKNQSEFVEGFESIANAVDSLSDCISNQNHQRKEDEPQTNPFIFTCPGHKEFFHRYKSREKAKEKAALEVKRKENDSYMKHVKYELIDAKTPEGKKSGLFGGLNGMFYNYAVNIIFYHFDDCKHCHYHPEYKA